MLISSEKINLNLSEPIQSRQVKIMLVGDSGVGKTSFIYKLIDKEGKPEETNAVDIFFKPLKNYMIDVNNFFINFSSIFGIFLENHFSQEFEQNSMKNFIA